MALYCITAPVAGVNEVIAGVRLVDSTGYTDDEAAVAYFRRHGYQVEQAEPAGEQPEQPEPAGEQPEQVKQPEQPTKRAKRSS